MRIRMLRRVYLAGSSKAPGEVVVVDEATARRHVEAGEAEALDSFTAPGRPTIPPPELTGESLPVAPTRDGEVVVKVGGAEVKLVTMTDGKLVEVPRDGRAG